MATLAPARDLLLPAKPDIERLVLGSILVSGGRLMASAREVLERDTFTGEPHRRLWDAMLALDERGQQIDRITVYHAVESAHPGTWTLADLVALDDDSPDLPAVDTYVSLLVECATRRKAIFALSDLAHTIAAGSATGDALAEAEGIARRFAALAERKRQALTVEQVVRDAG
ncbi:MAG: hypothetical protein MUF01_04715, partial [Bryobacterales bacterium]|nr:hypothetical protein [Bryobacterales bacterium]